MREKESQKILSRRLVLLSSLLILIFEQSCRKQQSGTVPRSLIASEIICPSGQRYMIRYAFASEVREAIVRDYKRKVADKSNESYTAMKIPGIESFLIEKNSPEKMMECEVREAPMKQIYHNYIRHF